MELTFLLRNMKFRRFYIAYNSVHSHDDARYHQQEIRQVCEVDKEERDVVAVRAGRLRDHEYDDGDVVEREQAAVAQVEGVGFFAILPLYSETFLNICT